MKFTPVKTPKFVEHVLPNLVWNVHDDDQALFLTFDDGPTPEITDWTLDVLHTYNAKATFFCIGKNVEQHPQLYQRILDEGHAVGNHTQNHVKGWKTKTPDYMAEVEKAATLINSKLFRPPYGQIKPKQAKVLSNQGYNIIMWNILSFDWNKSVTPKECLDNVLLHADSGDIIVFHDSIKASKNMMFALPKVLEHFKKEGFKFKRIPESTQ